MAAREQPLNVPPLLAATRDYVARALAPGGHGELAILDDSARAWLALGAAQVAPGMLVVVAENTMALELLWQDVQTLGGGLPMVKLPALNVEASKLITGQPSPDVSGERMNTLRQCLAWQGRGLLVTCVQALLEPVATPEQLQQDTLHLREQQECDLEQLCGKLVAAGYAFESEVLAKGQASRRGGLLDVWPLTEDWPVRLEFFGDVLEGLRSFDPAEQRSRDKLREVWLPPARDAAADGPAAAPTDYVPADASFLWLDNEAITHHYAMSAELAGSGETALAAERDYANWQLMLARRCAGGGQLTAGGADLAHDSGAHPVAGLAALTAQAVPPDVLETERQKWFAQLHERAAAGWTVDIFFATDAGRRRFAASFRKTKGIHLRLGGLSGGCEVPSAQWMAVAEADLYGARRALPPRRKPRGGAARDATGERLTDWSDLRPGELVVHVEHGIGKYLGLYEIVFDGQLQEALAVEYADEARLYVPTSQTHLLSRYIGVGRTKPPLHTLGGKRWTKEKIAAARAANDLAAQMLETQARRAALQGHAFAPDTPWQHDFEQAFPFPETDDQLRAIADVKRDMEAPQPMDRLICGDVGYGKTEVALRAAFKAVMDGKQVAVLVPTTVLAQQHYETFQERMGRFPITVEMVSRFRSRAEQAATLVRLAEKKVDVLIGTHRLLQRDVRFADLGLVIIDEEQRFGVAAKEHLKRLRELVDVLTLSATPIPRTLYLSLTGARDMSLIQTPPRERLAIETYIAQDSDELLREVILREVNRGGQVFLLHNRVRTIEWMRERLARLLPGIRVGVGHGQMKERQLADIMRRFVRREFDVLLCTTIIESGVDIPNVNTILIDRADRFGMADLYQLRGRVGRSRHQAYAYLLLPRHGALFNAARRRISAIRRHTSLGAGFKLALRDLEIRGAGNVLGAAQSGHIAAVGFDLYCQLLNRTIARLKGAPERPLIDVQLHLDFLDLTPDPAHEAQAAVIPRNYVEDESQRIGLYRKLAGVAYASEVRDLQAEFRDRYGPLPAPVRRLLACARIRLLAAALGVKSVATDGNRLLLGLGADEYLMVKGRHLRLHQHDPDDRLAEIEKRLRQLVAAKEKSDG